VRSALPSLLLLAAFAVALVRLAPLHPIQIWSGSWALASTLYALRLLPYRHLSWLTVALVCGSTLAFALGALVGERVGRRAFARRERPLARSLDPAAVRLAAGVALFACALLLAVFLAQLTARYGVLNALRVSRPVRLALVDGGAPRSFVYGRFAVVAAALCALSAVLAQDGPTRRRWLLAAAAAAATLYFSTGRQLLVDALLVAASVFVLGAAQPLPRRRLALLAATLATVTLVIFVAVGSLIGNTYQSGSESKFDNFFSRRPAISWLAPAYAHASAPLPALDLAVKVSSTWGRAHGCATAALECRLLGHAGVPVDSEPPAPPFTQAPLPWNAYTFLGSLLVDGGTALVLVLVGLCGALLGALWSLHRSGSAYGTLAYAFAVPALVWAYRQNLLDVELAAALLTLAMAWAATRAVGVLGAIRPLGAASRSG
jgi:hypothetical protein